MSQRIINIWNLILQHTICVCWPDIAMFFIWVNHQKVLYLVWHLNICGVDTVVAGVVAPGLGVAHDNLLVIDFGASDCSPWSSRTQSSWNVIGIIDPCGIWLGPIIDPCLLEEGLGEQRVHTQGPSLMLGYGPLLTNRSSCYSLLFSFKNLTNNKKLRHLAMSFYLVQMNVSQNVIWKNFNYQ